MMLISDGALPFVHFLCLFSYNIVCLIFFQRKRKKQKGQQHKQSEDAGIPLTTQTDTPDGTGRVAADIESTTNESDHMLGQNSQPTCSKPIVQTDTSNTEPPPYSAALPPNHHRADQVEPIPGTSREVFIIKPTLMLKGY